MIACEHWIWGVLAGRGGGFSGNEWALSLMRTRCIGYSLNFAKRFFLMLALSGR